jgi:UDP-N-acetylmuramyl pentapeptide phosphotransferase/UDP-N-acetylglucosamine-1-phosphate transferase
MHALAPAVLVAVTAALGVSALAVVLLRRFARWLPVANPGHRTLHDRPVPRIGGVSILGGYAAGLAAGG